MRPRSTCTRVMGREEYGEGKELLMILSIPPHQWSMVVVVSWRGHVWLPVELVLLYLLMMWLLTKGQDEFWSVSGNIICSYSAKCFRTHWTALHSADGQWPKAYCKSNQRVFEGKEVDCYAMAKSITWPESDWACISLAEDKTEGKMPQEQAGTEDGCSRGLAEHHQGWNPASGDVYAFQTSGCNWLQRICNQVLKSESLIYMIIILSHYFWSLNKWEAHMQTVVIPTPFTWFGCKYPQIKADSLQLKHILFVSFEIHCGGV